MRAIANQAISMKFLNLYNELGIKDDADEREIKKAYKKISIKYPGLVDPATPFKQPLIE